MKLTLNSVLCRGLAAGALFGVALPAASPALAQDEEQMVEELVVVGSRRQDRSAADSPVPVDVIGGDSLLNLGDTDMDSLLAALVPSYNVDQQPISDAATIIRPANLRALPSDATLVLVNGKRRHRASVITWLGGGISSGSHGPDLSIIPAIALDRVEVLRDGASAQYGSDAIAGVMNFVLREDRQGGRLEGRWGRTYEGDGDTMIVAGNVGLPLMDSGFLNLSMEYKQADPTNRSIQRADAQDLIDAGNNNVRQPEAQIWGAPEIRGDIKLFANMGVDVGASSEFYAFGNYAQRTVEGGFFFRNPHTRNGIFRGDPLGDRTPTVKVADLSSDGVSGGCPNDRRADGFGGPGIPIIDNVPDAATLAEVAANPNCYSFYERFPGGFTPQFGGDVTDYSAAFGLRGETGGGWDYDLSYVFGYNKSEFFMHNTINPQLAARQNDIPTSYIPGAYIETDQVFDATLSKPLEGIGPGGRPLYLALGFEYRTESFEVEAGGENAWYIDDRGARTCVDPVLSVDDFDPTLCDAGDPGAGIPSNRRFVVAGLSAQGFGVGSNGFPGFQPRDAGENSRGSYAFYVDVETNATEDLLLGAALRFEDYDDFGRTTDGKLAARYQLTDNFALRGAVSTGFRAPTVGQANVTNVTTAFGPNGLEDQATLPPTHPISAQKGGRPLQPEESVNTTLGLVLNIGVADITLDYYNVAVEGRIGRRSPAQITRADIDALVAGGVSDATSFSAVRFYINDFDTTTQGVDLVLTAPLDIGEGDTTLILVGNRNDTDVDTAVCRPGQVSDNCSSLINDQLVTQLKKALPRNRVSATVNHVTGDWRFLGRFRRYGEFVSFPADVGPWRQDHEPRWFLDAEVAYSFSDALTVVAGAQNLLDEYPQESSQGAQDGVGMLYPENSPYGFNGGFYYLRAIWDFN